jgi:cytidylate kinase
MTIITISRGSFSKGREVAEATAERLGFDCVSRDVLLDASDQYNIQEIKLERAIHDAPSILDRLTHGRQQYMAYIRSALAERVVGDDVVYHGLAGHLLLKGIQHVLKVRIIADLENRIAHEVTQEQISENDARERIARDDEARRRWTQSLYGVDPNDPSLYDLVIHIHRLTIDDAVSIICRTVAAEQFATTTTSQRKMVDLALACRVKAVLVQDFADVAVVCEYGNVLVYTSKTDRKARRLEERVRALAAQLAGINNVEVHSGVPCPPGAI